MGGEVIYHKVHNPLTYVEYGQIKMELDLLTLINISLDPSIRKRPKRQPKTDFYNNTNNIVD